MAKIVKLKGGAAYIEDATSNAPVTEGDSLTFNVTAVNGAWNITSWDPDKCSAGVTTTPGYLMRVDMRLPDGSVVNGPEKCVHLSRVGVNKEDWGFNIDTSNIAHTGSVAFDFRLVLPKSGKQTRWFSRSVEINPRTTDGNSRTTDGQDVHVDNFKVRTSPSQAEVLYDVVNPRPYRRSAYVDVTVNGNEKAGNSYTISSSARISDTVTLSFDNDRDVEVKICAETDITWAPGRYRA